MTQELIQHIESHDSLQAIADQVCDRVFFKDLDRFDAAFEIRHRLNQAFDMDSDLWHSVRGVDFVEVIEHFMDKNYENY